jgi:hypothetical protein
MKNQKATHTKGPWIALYTPAMNLAGIHIRDRNERGLEIAYCNSSDTDRPEQDAKLMAAAPDLLDALRKIEKTLLEKHQGIENHTYELMVIGDAIAKAEGNGEL